MTQPRASDIESTRPRSRAPRACARCHQKKVQCDGARVGLPCTRCRHNNYDHCAFHPSRRGTYTRRKRGSIFTGSESMGALNAESPEDALCANRVSSLRSLAPASPFADEIKLQNPISTDVALSSARSEVDSTPSLQEDFTDSSTCSLGTCPPSTDRRSSTASLGKDSSDHHMAYHENTFERFEVTPIGRLDWCHSALEEPTQLNRSLPHQSSTSVAVQTRSQDHHDNMEGEAHVSHMSTEDIGYLRSKGVFEYPRPDVLEKFMEAFSMHFSPLYSIFDIEELEKSYRQQSLPQILLHAICLIGVTYCDQSVIEHAGYSSRRCARRIFYDKTKLLFDLGYESNEIVLLQSTLMLSFWGPQTRGYSNPYSWICSAVDIAESLSIQRERSFAQISDVRHKGLLRRLWWTVVRRDAYFAALLGRPSQINMSQCDIKMLTLDDFDSTLTIRTGIGSAIFQIECAKLSLVLRCIIQQRYEDTNKPTDVCVPNLHDMLQQWQTELHVAVDWRKQTGTPEIFSTSLKLMFCYHSILIRLDRLASDNRGVSLSGLRPSTAPSKAVESAAQTISSTAFSLLMHSMSGRLPHEVFPAFFMAGIVFVRYAKRQHDLIASLGTSALHNCQLILNEVKERWDPSHSVLKHLELSPFEMQEIETKGLGNRVAIVGPRPKPFQLHDDTDKSHELDMWSPWQNADSGRTYMDGAITIFGHDPKFNDCFIPLEELASSAEDAFWLDSEISIFE